MEYFECNYALERIRKLFLNSILLKKEQRSGNGQWVLNFKISENLILYLSSDRGILDIYLFNGDKSLRIMTRFPHLSNLSTSKENIDKIINCLYEHQDEIFSGVT